MQTNIIYNEDCLLGMQRIPDASVDMILCDLPYGTTECKWDSVIPFDRLWAHYRRVIVERGAIVLFGNFPFSANLCISALDIFRYPLVWKRSSVSRYAQANYRPLSSHEDILVFSKGKCSENSILKMKYNPQGVEPLAKARVSNYKAHSLRPGRAEKVVVQTMTGYPRSILEFSREGRPIHPTQKPVALFEYLIRTYTNEGETVLDNAMGSGTTAIACLNTNRKYVGFEKDKTYFQTAQRRIAKHTVQPSVAAA